MMYQSEDRAGVYSLLHKSWWKQKGATGILRTMAEQNAAERLWMDETEALALLFPDVPDFYWEIWQQARRKADLPKITDYLQRNRIGLIALGEMQYPLSLSAVSDMPAFLYYKGNPETIMQRSGIAIGIVGSRNADTYGMQTAERLGQELSAAGVCVISGLAKGIDACAHNGALKGSGGTVAVQGCGLDKIYPRQNTGLAKSILEHERGCLLSEFPLGCESEAWHFPKRNRIISGLSNGVIVVQATAKSGVFSTVESALNQGKDVFAVPGNIDNPLSYGPNLFLKEGAMLTDSGKDVLQFYGIVSAHDDDEKSPEKTGKKDYKETEIPENNTEYHKNYPSDSVDFSRVPENILLTDDEKSVLLLFQREPLSVESLIGLSGKNTGDLSAILSMLEIYGLIRQQPGRYYIRIR